MTRFLVTGASGLLGLNFALTMHGKEHQVVGSANTGALPGVPFEYIQAELTEPGTVERLVEESRPDVIVHCAAMANMEASETNPQLAARVNAALPGQLAETARRHGIYMIQISTDAVFDGSRGNYLETDTPHPLSVYARTKWEGENAVLLANPEAFVARVNFYGWSSVGNRSLAEFFVNNLMSSNRIKGFCDVFFCPMMVHDLTNLLVEAALAKLQGIYHVVGAQVMSKYDFGMTIAKKFGFDTHLIEPASVMDGGLKAARSPNLTLNTDKITAALGHALPNFTAGLDKFYEQYRGGYRDGLRAFAQPVI